MKSRSFHLRFVVELYSLTKCVLVLHIWKICLISKTTVTLQSALVMALQIEKMVEVR